MIIYNLYINNINFLSFINLVFLNFNLFNKFLYDNIYIQIIMLNYIKTTNNTITKWFYMKQYINDTLKLTQNEIH
jgi:hypothetical protein